MRIGLIADIHGNDLALAVVLAALDGEDIDRLVCLGDVAATGPQPREAIARLRDVGCPTVMGNADAWLLDPPAVDDGATDDARKITEIDQWCADQLDPDDVAFLRGLAPTVAIDLGHGAGTLLCCHGSPRSFDEQITATTSDAELDALLVGIDAAIIASGHTHLQLLRRYRNRLLFNPGSVGLTIDAVPPADDIRGAPWAEYAIIAVDDRGGLSVSLHRVPFDVAALGDRAREWEATRRVVAGGIHPMLIRDQSLSHPCLMIRQRSLSSVQHKLPVLYNPNYEFAPPGRLNLNDGDLSLHLRKVLCRWIHQKSNTFRRPIKNYIVSFTSSRWAYAS